MTLSYIELHRHTMYSHDGSGQPMMGVRYAKELGHTALGLTDHGNINGLIDHYTSCVQEGIKPILGCEVYFQPEFRKSGTIDAVDDEGGVLVDDDHDIISSWTTADRYHLTVLCENLLGYQNLCAMLTHANKNQFYKVPIVTLEDLLLYGEGLIFLTGCLSSFTSQMILAGDVDAGNVDAARYFIESLHTIPHDQENVFLEVQPFPAPGQDVINRQLCVWSDIHGWPLVMTSDAHFVQAENYESHLVMQKIRKPYADGKLNDFHVRHIHTGEEMFSAWNEYMPSNELNGLAAIEATQMIADRCEVNFSQAFHMPDMSWLNDTPEVVLPKKVGKGLRALGLYTESMSNGKVRKTILPAYEERVTLEIERISQKGFAPYILLCADIVDFCKEQGIAVQARGSACGSEVCHALGISKVDALKYGTSFDRFIAASGEKFPDIDLDIEDVRKKEVVDYMTAKYPGSAAQICTFGCFKQKATLNGIVKAMSLDMVSAELFKDAMSSLPDVSLSAAEIVKTLAGQGSVGWVDLIQHYAYIYGQVSFIGKHAAGVAITHGPLSDYMVVQRVGSGSEIEYVTSFDMEALDELGILKVDLLGLSALTMLREGFASAGVDVDEADLWGMYNDKGVLDAFAQGDTLGIFQSERWQPTKMYRTLKPSTWSDLCIVNASNRPEPLSEGTLDVIVAGKAGNGDSRSIWAFCCPETYGGLLYQEQIMRICAQMGGLSDAQTARVLKLLKRYHENDRALEQDFVDGCINNGYDKMDARVLWGKMHRYLFNMGHTVAYSMISAQQQWLKQNHPAHFYAALLAREGDKDKRRVYVADALRHHVGILIPHVNGGATYGLTEIKGKLFVQEGLINLPNIGPATAAAIERERDANGPFTDEADFTTRYKGAAKIDVLRKFGALSYGKDYTDRVKGYYQELNMVRGRL